MTQIDYQTYVAPLVARGITDNATIASELAPRHKRNILATGSPDVEAEPDLFHLVVSRYSVLAIGDDATWQGPLRDYMRGLDESIVQNVFLKAGFAKLLTSLQITSRHVLCHSDGKTGQLVSAITEIVADIVDLTPLIDAIGDDVRADMLALTGGLLFPDGVTADDIADAKAAEQSRVDAEATAEATAEQARLLNGRVGQAVGIVSNQIAEDPAMTDEQIVTAFGTALGGVS